MEAKGRKNLKVPSFNSEVLKDQRINATYETSTTPVFLSTTESLVTENKGSSPYLIRSTMYSVYYSDYYHECCSLPLGLSITPFSEKGMYSEVGGLDICKYCRSYFNMFTGINENGFPICRICGNTADEKLQYSENTGYSSIETSIPNESDGNFLYKRPITVFVFDSSFSMLDEVLSYFREIVQDEMFKSLYRNIAMIYSCGGSFRIFTKIESGISVIRILDPCDVTKIPLMSPRCIIDIEDTSMVNTCIDVLEEQKGESARSVGSAVALVKILGDISKYSVGTKAFLFSSMFDESMHYEELLTNIQRLNLNIFTDGISANNKNSLHKFGFHTSGIISAYEFKDIGKLRTDMLNIIFTRTAFNVKHVLKVSSNISKEMIISPNIAENLSYTLMPAMASGMGITAILGISGFSKQCKHIQHQVTYTDHKGKRKIRILNIEILAGIVQQVYSKMSVDTLFNILCKLHIFDEIDIKDLLVKTLSFYRNKCSTTASETQLVLPETLKCLPLLLQSYKKLTHIDKMYIMRCGTEETLRYFYPRLFPLSGYTGRLVECETLGLRLQNIADDEIYILENGREIFIYVPNSIDQELFSNLFSTGSTKIELKEAETSEEARLLSDILEEIEVHYGYYMNKVLIRPGDLREVEFLNYMVEDSMNDMPDYVDYIFDIHFEVKRN